MAFTVQELDNIASAALDFHMDRGKVHSQTIQNKPLLRDLRAAQKTFPGGKENITVRVKGVYTSAFQGYSHDDEVDYANPANIKTAEFPWKELHNGIKVTMTELKKDGISITESATGKGESRHSERELTALANLLEDKLEDMEEGGDQSLHKMYWRDGTQDADEIPGIRSFILNDPTSATIVGGIDQQANTWWRNRAVLAVSTSSAADQLFVQTLQKEFRQLRRYGNPNHKLYAGSDLMDWFEKELRAKGNYTLEGWANKGVIDASVADLAFKGKMVEYDPMLDDLSLSKYLFVIDTKAIKPMVMESEDMKRHNPARPENKYVIYRAVTYTGGLVCRQRNTSGVYSIA